MSRVFEYTWIDPEEEMPPESSSVDGLSIRVKLRIICKTGSVRYDYGYFDFRSAHGCWRTNKSNRKISGKVIGWCKPY